MTSSKYTSFEDKLRAATQMPQPRPEFLANLRTNLAVVPPQPISFGERIRLMLRQPAWLASMVTLLLVAALLISGPQRVFAAVAGFFGYIPDVGIVENSTAMRVLEEPVSLTRDGITVTVEQVVLNSERTTLVYSVEGIPGSAESSNPKDQRCSYKVALRLPGDTPGGVTLLASPEGLQGWASGYQHRFNYAAVPVTVNDATLVIDCLFNTRAGAAPENWEIPLHFVPAPAEMTAFPVIEIATSTESVVSGAASPTDDPDSSVPATEAAQENISMALTLDRAVQMDDGYLLYATLDWQNTPFLSVDVTSPEVTLHLLDGNGQEMLYEVHYDEQTMVNVDQRKTVFAIKTAPVQAPGPLTLVLDSVLVGQSADASFVFDPGPNPQPEQEWQPDQEITVGEHRLRVTTVIAHETGYEVGMTSDSGILGAACADHDHPIISGSGGGDVLGCSFNYADALPTGPITISIDMINLRHVQALQAQWTPPAASTTLPTQPASCLNADVWKASLAQPPSIPAGLPGTVLVNDPVDKNNINGPWQVEITTLDGATRQAIPGATDGAFSPDGKKVAYAMMDGVDGGIAIKDLESGEAATIPGTGRGDFNPLWSPDGSQIVFNRGMGIFDLFITHLDGSDLRPLTTGGVQEWPVGWLPGGPDLLYSVPGRDDEATVYQVNVQTGESQVFSQDRIENISPDGQKILMMERTFGDRFLVSVSGLDGSNRQTLNDGSLWVLYPTWSPDGKWLLADISDADAGSAIGALINLDTCQVIPLPNVGKNILSWAP